MLAGRTVRCCGRGVDQPIAGMKLPIGTVSILVLIVGQRDPRASVGLYGAHGLLGRKISDLKMATLTMRVLKKKNLPTILAFK